MGGREGVRQAEVGRGVKGRRKRSGRRTSLIDHLQHRLPRLHVGEDFHAVRHLAERGRVVVGVGHQDVDGDRDALLDAVRRQHL